MRKHFSLLFYHILQAVPHVLAALCGFIAVYSLLAFCLCNNLVKRQQPLLKYTVFSPLAFLVWLGKRNIANQTDFTLEESGDNHIKVNNLIVPKSIVRLFGMRLLLYAIIAIALSWEAGIVGVTTGRCIPEADCFVPSGGGTGPVSVLVENCSSLRLDEEDSGNSFPEDKEVTTIECYTVVHDLHLVPAVLGGAIVLVHGFMKVVSRLYKAYHSLGSEQLQYYSLLSMEERTCHPSIVAIVVAKIVFLVVVPPALLAVVWVLLLWLVPIITQREAISYGVMVTLGVLAFYAASLVPWNYLIGQLREQGGEEEEEEALLPKSDDEAEGIVTVQLA